MLHADQRLPHSLFPSFFLLFFFFLFFSFLLVLPTGWVIAAVPEGTPPAKGWPIYLSFTIDTFPVRGSATCGPEQRLQKNFTAFATPAESMNGCHNASVTTSTVADTCDAAMGNVRSCWA
jgi:hypothetical protein